MEWLHRVLADVSRVAHYHPLRPEVPLEVLSLDLLAEDHAPSEIRAALEQLAALHAAGDSPGFHSAMAALSPWRNSYLYAKGLSRDAFPLIAVEITPTPALDAAEAFLSVDNPSTCGVDARLGLFLRIQLTEEGIEDENDTLSRVAEMLLQLRSERSMFRLEMVQIEFDTHRMRNHELEMASRALALALHDVGMAAPAFKISVGMVGSASTNSVPITTWGMFFQTLCRVGADRDSTASAQGNELSVSFAEDADPRVVTAFWSAMAFSSGYSRLSLCTGDSHAERVQAKYMALALLSPVSQVTHLDWFNSLFQASNVDAMLQVRDASSPADLSSALWSRDWSYQSTGQGIELAATNQSIARQLGWVLCDSGESEWIEVFLPGYAQCSVRRAEWNALTADRPQQSGFSGVLQDCKLTHFESAMQLSEPTTHIHAGRFFRFIGGSLRLIELRPWRYTCSLELVRAIFESCPLLRELIVHQVQLAPAAIEIDTTRLVSTNLVKLQLHSLNDTTPIPTSGLVTETFFETVIPIIGQKMEYLELRKQHGIIPFARAFNAIAQSCISLFHLKLEHLDVETLDPLITAYRDGRSRISSLYLLKSPVTSSSLVRFAEFLADRSRPGSLKLGVLHVTHFADNLSDSVQLRGLDVTAIKAILAMLGKNLTLTELYLGVTDTGVGHIVPEPLRPFKRRFDMYDEQEIPVASEKFPIESTVAFVDVLQRKRLPYDQETIRIVTIFAAQRIRRSVRYDVVN